MSALPFKTARPAHHRDPLVTIAHPARRHPGTHRRAAFPATPALIGALLVAATLPLSITGASAASFTVSANSSTAQTLGTASGQTGAIAAGKSLTVGGATVAVTISGNAETLSNLGTIAQTGNGRVVRDNTGVTALVINNGSSVNAGALMQAADADVIQMNKAAASVTLNNYGTLNSLNASAGGSQAVDFSAITSGANIVNNFAGARLLASEADAVRPGANGVVTNAGTIRSVSTTGSGSDGIDGQNNAGIRISNAATGLVDGARHGITGAQLDSVSLYTMSVSNDTGGIIRGNNGSGINLDGFNALQVATVVNHGSIIGQGVTGDGDGVDVDGLANITNTGIIRSVNAFSLPGTGPAFSEGITVGGGTIINSGLIEGLVSAGNTNALGRGITLAGNDIASGALAGTREGLYGNAVISNQAGGVIRGQSDSAIIAQGAASGYTLVITNNAGATILGGGLGNAAILTGANRSTINNAGTIDGASSGKAIEMAGANNTLVISGANAAVIGSINGGSGAGNTMAINAGAGNGFAYAGAISHFSSVEVQSGNVTLSGANSYVGATILSGGLLTLDGANRINAASALVLDGGALALENAGGANGQSFASLSLNDSSSIDLGASSLTFQRLGMVGAGTTLTMTDFNALGSSYALRFLGDYSADASFLALVGASTINGQAAAYKFDGAFTDVLTMSAVPEPGSFALFMTSLGVMGALTRRRKGATAA